MKIPALIFCALLLTACGEKEQKQNQVNQEIAEQDKKHLLSDQKKMIQKAKDAEKLILEADDKRRKQLNDNDN